MNNIILTANWFIYGALFMTFFIKLTDERERDTHRKIAYLLLMLCSLFFSVTMFKQVFLFDANKSEIKFNIMETLFNGFILFLMLSKVKDDKFFDKIKRKKK